MARAQILHEVDFDKQTMESSLKSLRQNLSQLRRQAHDLDQTALEDCLSLAISLTQPRYTKND